MSQGDTTAVIKQYGENTFIQYSRCVIELILIILVQAI